MITNKIESLLKQILEELEMPLDNPEVIISNRKDLCDYQFDGAFKLAKLYHKSPLDIASLMVEKMKGHNYFSQVDFVAPGFVNFTLSDTFINETLNDMLTSPFYNIKKPEKKTIVIDYGGPNIAKPLHVGHLRSAVVGESIKRMLKFMGHTVISDVHLGDYGLQIGQVIYGLQEKNVAPHEITLSMLEEIYPQMSQLCKENEEVKTKCALITKELQDGNETYQEYFKVIRKLSGNDIKRIYDYLDVSFDYWYGESDSYPYIEMLTKDLEAKNLLEESEGAKIIEVKKETDTKELPPLIYQKSNGAYLYGTTDLGTIKERVLDFSPDEILYVADRRQNLHFESVFRVCEKLGLRQKFEFLGFGTVNGKDGKPFKTRSGHTPKLDDLFKETKEIFTTSSEKNQNMSEEDLDILVNAIIKFADLQNNREKDYIFDIAKFSQTTGKTGPYILYTYLRVQNILKQFNLNDIKLNNTIYNKEDRDLRLKLIELEQVINLAVEDKMPSVIANYIYDLCVNMNAFYENNHINNLKEEEKKQNWLCILNLTNSIIKDLLNILSIKIPERM